MTNFHEVMVAESNADNQARAALESNVTEYAVVHMLEAIRLEIRAQGMRVDYVSREAMA